MAQYKRIGTTARADPVSNTDLLFPNGYNRNENTSSRPLVKVLDVADTDDKYCEEDFAFIDDENLTENVTVTIKLCSDGIVTETEANQKKFETGINSSQNKKEDTHNVTEGATGISNIIEFETEVSNDDLSEDMHFHDAVSELSKHSGTLNEGNQKKTPKNDNLFEEYERFVDRSSPANSSPGNIQKTDVTITSTRSSPSEEMTSALRSPEVSPPPTTADKVVKPKVKIVKAVALKSFQNETVSPSSTLSSPGDSPKPREHSSNNCKRNIFSPKTRTPIVIESCPYDTDEGQDFMTYLQELKQTPSAYLDNTINVHALGDLIPPDSLNNELPSQNVPLYRKHREEKLDERDSDVDQTQHSLSHTSARLASEDAIIISDDENNTETGDLVDFNFSDFTNQKLNSTRNNENETDNGNKQTVTVSAQFSNTNQEGIIDIIAISDEEDEEEEEDDAEEETNDKKDRGDARKDEDKEGSDDEKGSGSGNGGSNESSDDRSGENRDTLDEEPHESDDSRGSNEPSDNKVCYSSGVRSRGITTVDTEGEFGDVEDNGYFESLNLLIECAIVNSSSDDEEVKEILEIPRRQDSIDCHFETIENRVMGPVSISDSSDSIENGYNVPCEMIQIGNDYKNILSDKGFVKVVTQNSISVLENINDCSSPTESVALANNSCTAEDNMNMKSRVHSLDDEIRLHDISDSSSPLDTDGDFDSALEEEFWKRTSYSCEGSGFSNSSASDDNGTSGCIRSLTSTPSGSQQDSSRSDTEFESANEFEDDGETTELKYRNDASEKSETESQMVHGTVGTDNSQQCKDETEQLAEQLENKHIRKARLATRNVSYNVPYLKQNTVEVIDPNMQKKLRYICSLRRGVLAKTLPPFDSIDFEFEILKQFKRYYIENDIDWATIQNNALNNDKDIPNDNEPLGIRNLGRGFYIFGAADGLPAGPKLRKIKPEDEKWTRSIYFRGVPGILHNANKMSHYMFPKLVFPKESASRKILHACNRLATQLSPLSPCVEFRHGIMQEDKNSEDNGTDSTISLGLADLLMAAKDLLNSSRLEDAEIAFLKLYKEIQEKPEDSACLLVESLSGLADICIRRSRMCRSNPLEWQWLCMHAIALLQYTVEFCESELENQLDNQEMEWFTEQKMSAENKCRPLEDAFLRALYNCLKQDVNAFDPFQSFSVHNTPVSQSRVTRLFPLSSTMPQYLVVPGMRYRLTDKGMTKQCADDVDVTVDWLAKFQHYCKDRLQSKDSRGVTEKILKSQNDSKAEDDTESCMSHGSHDSLDWDHSDLQGIDEITEEVGEESPVSDLSLEYELVLGDSENEGWDFFLHQRRNCNFESVVQVGNNFEKDDERDKESRKLAIETSDKYHQEKGEKTEKVKKKHSEPRDIVSPLHAHSISLTLARSFCRLADKLVHEEEYRKAEAVYEKILDIVDTIQDGTAGMLRFSARIMKNLGTVKSKQGKSSSGLVLLNKALNTYRDLQDEEANFEIAVALIELGNGYIVGKNHEDSVFDDVIVAICDFFEKDASDSHSASTSSSGSASQISQMTSSLGSNSEERNVEEAVMCYSEAIALLDHYEADDKQMDMFAKAVMRLGDCHFMQKDYDKALESYEKALGMFKANNVYGKDSLMENAHVLCMLGVSSFMLHVYPRAASVFEMALHMVRCAYGFKRTFLNGMLQSLSGITYYKMKNYHKCVSMCYQGYETYCEIFGEGMSRLDKQKFWLVCQTLYVMGNSYNILNLQQKAMKYLKTARSLMKSSKCRERRQFMRVLQILGDAYFAQYDYKTALQYYNEALEYGECESQVSFDEVFDPNCASDEMTIHNHLVSKSAEAHLSMQQYQNAVHYLEQAHDMQEVMGEDIKEDLINTLNQLGHMHSVAGDVNKAIESYKECLEVFSEIHKGKLGPEMCTTLGNLGAICYVKACISASLEEENEMTMAADGYFQDAIQLERNAEVCVKYGNFLYSQCNFNSAIMYLNDALHVDRATCDIVYGGLEKVTLPELLQDEVDTQEEICLPSSCLARYLLILSHKAILDMEMAEHNLICLMEDVMDFDIPLLHSLLGYAMMEMMLFEEAAKCFLRAAESEEDYQLAYENYCVCLLVMVHRALKNGLENIVDYYRYVYRSTFTD